MQLSILIIILALFQYIIFSFKVGKARDTYQIKAPAVSGHPVFERLYRVQQNTVEQLILFLPAVLVFVYMADRQGWPGDEIAAALGAVWLIGRGLYARSYVKNPSSRAVGFLMTMGPSVLMLLLALVLTFKSLL